MPLARQSIRFTFLGCGFIGSSILRALLPSIKHAGSPISKVTIALNNEDVQERLRESFRGKLDPATFLSRQNVKAVKDSDAVLLALPPENFHEVLSESGMREALQRKTIISILARTTRDEISNILQSHGNFQYSPNNKPRIIRAMPTMGAQLKESATLISDIRSPAEQEAMELATWIFSTIGKVFNVTDGYFDEATGMSAFTNAVTTVTVNAIARQAVSSGVPEDHAISIASQCVRGTASLMLAGISPEKLQESLSAPGSITGQAISSLQASTLPYTLQNVLSTALERASDHSK
ncbi:hypothetical protein N7478_004422 [Penicillium angulare]|uniref:uncharacterized protein n=1 Tax=Penicillium angulare TaxID=116970 RepID=UPI00254086D3|nr:uncharacterized protein N7478_004422 [Penicillium angulare]KAJ5279050.1 hypothetical protein N7478_004422 [Penicillium angulare]